MIVGCDRVAANGDVANKVGTYALALAAAAAGIPFVVAGPTSTIDPACPTGAQIEIEERDADEVRAGLDGRPARRCPALRAQPGLRRDAGGAGRPRWSPSAGVAPAPGESVRQLLSRPCSAPELAGARGSAWSRRSPRRRARSTGTRRWPLRASTSGRRDRRCGNAAPHCERLDPVPRRRRPAPPGRTGTASPSGVVQR